MWMSPSTLLFVLLVGLSNIMVLSSPSLLISWVALELNTLAFIPLILVTKHKNSSEASVKYFLTQTIASIIFLAACLTQNLYFSSMELFSIFLIMALSIKLGAAPFHSWMPSVANSLSWMPFYLFLTVQKINPLIIMGVSLKSSFLLLFISSISLIVGAVQGLAYTQTRLLLVFSSINHIGWMYAALLMSLKLTFLYFIFYAIMLAPVITIMNNSNYVHINQLSYNKSGLSMQLIMFLNILSLGGLPPFLGFMPKWLILQNLVGVGGLFISVFMIFMSLITLYFYLRLTFSAFILSNFKWVLYKTVSLEANLLVVVMTLVSLGGLMLTFLY